MDPQLAPPKQTVPAPRTKRWQRRAVLYGALLLVVALVLLNPYARQSLFGPTVRGLPLCYWQDEFRMAFDRQAYESSGLTRLMAALGLRKSLVGLNVPSAPDMLPVYLSLL